MRSLFRTTALALAASLLAGLCACAGAGTPSGSASPDATTPAESALPSPSPTQEAPADPYEAVRTYWSPEELTQAWGPEQPVEHLFFHPIIAYPEFAFSDAVP